MVQVESNIWLILIAAISYFLGSFPTAYFVAKKLSGKDIRLEGSGNIGAMNAYRLLQEKSKRLARLGISLAMLGDVGKAALAIFIVRWLGFLEYSPIAALTIGSFFVVLGHNYSIFFNFRQGGRGIACLMGILLALHPPLFGAWGGTVLFSIFLVQHLLVQRITTKNVSKWFSIVSSQVLGRVVGIGISLVPIYFINPQLFYPILAATILVLIKNVERVKAYVRESGVLKSRPSG